MVELSDAWKQDSRCLDSHTFVWFIKSHLHTHLLTEHLSQHDIYIHFAWSADVTKDSTQ